MMRLDEVLMRNINIPKEIYYKMIEYLGTEDVNVINDFILDILESYIEIHTSLEDEFLEEQEYE